MSIISTNYRVMQGEYGLKVIEVTGRATSDERADLEDGVVSRYVLVPYPAAAGATFKILDGSRESYTTLTLPTGARLQCVKVAAEVNPMASTQSAGMPHAGEVIVRFALRYQQVGRLS